MRLEENQKVREERRVEMSQNKLVALNLIRHERSELLVLFMFSAIYNLLS